MDGADAKLKSKWPTGDAELALPTAPIELKARFGSSVIDQFVQGHSPADVFRELVQNEFDAHGSEITIRFGANMLTVSGTGRAVNPKGWKRLQVIMGTGTALGDGKREDIEAKQSGIGSKNFGIRSLFLFGNRINVRSDGKYAVIDMDEFGAAVAPDPATKGRKGILIQVPYRTKTIRAFKAFTTEHEQEAMDQIEKALLPTLVKLANPGKGPGINGLTVISERTGRELRWRQTANPLKSGLSGVTVTQRKGRLVSVDADGNRATRTNEQLEFLTLIDIPDEHAGIDFPAYYRSGRKIKISVSVQMKGKSLDLSHQGRLYYPLEAGLAPTGMAVSASAPFQLDADRSRLIPTSDWNNWLLMYCASLAIHLAGSDWFSRFGATGFHALAANGQGGSGSFQDWTYKALATGAYAPGRILAMNGTLYVQGYRLAERSVLKERPTTFSLHRIVGVVPTGEYFRFDAADNDARNFGLNWHQPKRIAVRIEPEAADYVRDRVWSGDQNIEPHPDGGIVLTVTTTSEKELQAWVWGFGGLAKIVEVEPNKDGGQHVE